MGDDANAPESSACVENCTASSVGTGLALGRYAASAGSGMGQPRDSKWVAKWLQGVRPLYRPAPSFIPHQSAGSCRPWPPSPARRKSPSPRCARAVRAGCSCTARTTAEASRSPSVQIDGPTRCSCPTSSRGLETDWMYGAVVYVDRERRIAYESIPDLLVHRDRCTAKVLGRSPGIAEIDRPTSIAEGDAHVESPGGISPPGAPRTVHDPLESHGSRCSAVAMT